MSAATPTPAEINSESCRFCYIDIDIDNHRSNLALTAAFVDATDSRYGFSSKDLRRLGGSELSRVRELLSNDHEWGRDAAPWSGGAATDLLSHGSRVVLRLHWDVAPLACENFAALCVNGGNSLDVLASRSGGGKGRTRPAPVGESGKALSYRGSSIHRVVEGFVVQGGDFVFGNGSGGESIYGKRFKDERAGLALRHDRAGILSMGNSGKNSNTSQFFVTLGPAPRCDGKHVVFGEVVSGMEVLRAVEARAAQGGVPAVPVTVTDCGAYTPLATPGDGAWYDRPDGASYSGVAPEFVVRPRVGVLAPTRRVAERFKAALGGRASTLLVAAEEEEGGEDDLVRSLTDSLGGFALDIVVAAPACARLLERMDVPPSWEEAAGRINGSVAMPTKQSVLLEAKPIEVLSAIHDRSWMSTRPDWLLGTTFIRRF